MNDQDKHDLLHNLAINWKGWTYAERLGCFWDADKKRTRLIPGCEKDGLDLRLLSYLRANYFPVVKPSQRTVS